MTNAGREYKLTAFDQNLKDRDIHILQSAPYTPQQNGCMEHLMCTLSDKAECMCFGAYLPENWWNFILPSLPRHNPPWEQKVLQHPGNIYGENQHPTEQLKELERQSKWDENQKHNHSNNSSAAPRQQSILRPSHEH